MNKLTLIGNLTGEPEVRSTPNGITACAFTIAVERRHTDKSGERPTDFFRITAWRQTGDACGRYLAKGKKVAVIGELQARLYEAKDGSTRLSLDVQADEVEFLSPRQNAQENGGPQDMEGFTDIQDDDIPF